jgi:3-hydroxymyristoyl/3-hydroxydecanoyl-(acyl carrier protein) dehydratase
MLAHRSERIMHSDTHREFFCIDTTHPALPGHFPGNPVVPGVILLDRVVAAIERTWPARVAGFAQVKFLRPLLPDREVELLLERAETVRFRIADGAETIASGSAEFAP